MRPTPRKPRLSSGKIRAFTPLLARTSTVHRPLGPVSYDCVKVIIVRKGSAILSSEFGSQPVKPGDVIALGANVLCGSEPEESITVTTIYLDTDFVRDQVRLQYAGFLDDRLDAQGFANTIYTEPAQILRLGEERGGMLMPWLDELVTLSIDGDFVRHYYRMQALWFQIAYVIAPFIKVSPVRVTPSQHAHIRPTLPRDRRFAPLLSDYLPPVIPGMNRSGRPVRTRRVLREALMVTVSFPCPSPLPEPPDVPHGRTATR